MLLKPVYSLALSQLLLYQGVLSLASEQYTLSEDLEKILRTKINEIKNKKEKPNEAELEELNKLENLQQMVTQNQSNHILIFSLQLLFSLGYFYAGYHQPEKIIYNFEALVIWLMSNLMGDQFRIQNQMNKQLFLVAWKAFLHMLFDFFSISAFLFLLYRLMRWTITKLGKLQNLNIFPFFKADKQEKETKP